MRRCEANAPSPVSGRNFADIRPRGGLDPAFVAKESASTASKPRKFLTPKLKI
jgi:hypothetical protein